MAHFRFRRSFGNVGTRRFRGARVYSSASFSAEAQSYFDRLDTAGDTTYTPYKQPLANYIDGLVTLGGAYWDTMLSATSFVGVGIQGVTVPLRDGMPTLTNNNFVAGDLNVLTGLKSDGSTKYIDTGTKFNDCPQNDFSMSVNVTETLLESNSGNYLAYQSFVDGVSQISSSNDAGVSNNDLVIRCQTRNANIISDQGSVEDFTGVSRELSTEYLVQYGASSTTITQASQAPANQIISLFGSSANIKTNARLATFHIGRSLDMPTLRGLQNTLITEVEAVWNTLVYQSDFANGATEWTAARGTNTAPDSPDASTNVMSYVPYVGIQTHYTRLVTSNINLTDEYLTQFEIYIPSSNVTVDGFRVTDWTSTTVFNSTIPTSDTWKSISFISKYENAGRPAIWQTAAGSSTFNGNGTDKIYIRNFRVSKQS